MGGGDWAGHLVGGGDWASHLVGGGDWASHLVGRGDWASHLVLEAPVKVSWFLKMKVNIFHIWSLYHFTGY